MLELHSLCEIVIIVERKFFRAVCNTRSLAHDLQDPIDELTNLLTRVLKKHNTDAIKLWGKIVQT